MPGSETADWGGSPLAFSISIATMELPAMGYGLRYEYGMFRQTIEDGWQREHPDNWLRQHDPWEVARPHEAVEIKLSLLGQECTAAPVKNVPGCPSTLIGIPFDRPVVGSIFAGTINTLRLWAAASPDYFDFQEFSSGDFVGALAGTLAAELLTRVLYPDDSPTSDRRCACGNNTFSWPVRCPTCTPLPAGTAIGSGSRKVAIQLNDTHPTLAVPELMRTARRRPRVGRAWDLTQNTLGYTNHRRCQKRSKDGRSNSSSHSYRAICRSSSRSIAASSKKWPDAMARRSGTPRRMSLVEEGSKRKIRMANLAIVGSHSTNGVAAIHSELLRKTDGQDFAAIIPSASTTRPTASHRGAGCCSQIRVSLA